MNYAWQGTIAEALAHANGGHLHELVRDGYKQSYGRVVSPAEEESWRVGLPPAIAYLARDLHKDARIVLEYRLPFNGQRADLVVLGQGTLGSSAHVVELKHWAESNDRTPLEHFVLTGGKETPHPSYQAASYAGKLKYFHSAAQKWNVTASALVTDTSSANHVCLKNGRYADLWTVAPVFLPEEGSDFSRFVSREIIKPPTDADFRSFLEGTYSQSLRLLDGITNHQDEIRNRALGALAVSGWGFSEEQLLVFDQVISAATEKRPSTFILSGGPGSGKTLLAIHLLLALAARQVKTVLAVRNNRLNAALKKVVNFRPFGGSGVIKYFSTQPYSKVGVEDDDKAICDVLVCDEGQRLNLRSNNVFQRAIVTVILYDESQILNREEKGTRERLVSMASGSSADVVDKTLPTLHRCRGGQAYLEWVEKFLTSPKETVSLDRKWTHDYEMSSVNSPKELIRKLTELRKSNTRVALLAAFTRSSGYDKPKSPTDLGRTRIPETDPPITWLMDPDRDYVPFWVEGRSNDLMQCASIYGCQGFETDYAGLIWGDDLVIRNGEWAVGDPDNCYDNAPGSTKLATVMRKEPAVALQLLKNRYRILLTRGIFGTLVYSEDVETQESFSELLR